MAWSSARREELRKGSRRDMRKAGKKREEMRGVEKRWRAEKS